MISTHSQRIERWLGPDKVEHLSRSMTDWYGPPIALAGVPGAVYATKGGDFIGEIRAGWEATWLDYAVDWKRRIQRGIRVASRINRNKMNAGFASLSDLIAEATAGKKRDFMFKKTGPTGVANVTSSLWRLGALPQGGAAPAAAPEGTVFTSASQGAFPFVNPTGGDTQHFVSASIVGNLINTLLLYDLIFGVAKTMASTDNEAVTGVPTRYQNTNAGSVDSAEGNFLFIQVGGTQLAATAHSWDAAANLYTNQAGTASQQLQTVTGVSAAIVDRLDDATTNRWFHPLAAGDTGIKALTQMHCDASVATGVIWFMIGHPIAFLPVPIANVFCQIDGINTAFNLTRIFDNACLAFLEVNKALTNAATYSGIFTTVAG